MGIKLYLDNCCFNRPYDDQDDMFIRIETGAKLYIQEKIKEGAFDLVWSFMLDYENNENPYPDIRDTIKLWRGISKTFVSAEDDVRKNANILSQEYKISGKDSLHIACALKSKSDYLITTDKKMIKKGKLIKGIKIINPLEFVNKLEEFND